MKPTQAATVILLWKVVDLHTPTPPHFWFWEYFLSSPWANPSPCCRSDGWWGNCSCCSQRGLLHTGWVTQAPLFKQTCFGLQSEAAQPQLDGDYSTAPSRRIQLKIYIEQTASSNIDTNPGITKIWGFTDIQAKKEEVLRSSMTGNSALGIIQQTHIHKKEDKASFDCCTTVYSLWPFPDASVFYKL